MVIAPVLAIVSLVQTLAVGMMTGAAISGAVEVGINTMSDYHEHGEVSAEMLEENVREAGPALRDGAVFGAVFPLASGPINSLLRTLLKPLQAVLRFVSQTFDDIWRFTRSASDDVGRVAGGIWDDIGKTVSNVATSFGSGFNYYRNLFNARFFQRLPVTRGAQSYVYVLDDAATGYTKIGITGNLPQRQKALQSAASGKLEFVCIISTTTARALEKTLHATFAAQRIPAQLMPNVAGRTEWFNLNPAQVQQACSY